MADAKTQQPPEKIERTIGKTTYIVISHFQEEGSTAVDKIRCLIDMNTKTNNSRQKIRVFDNILHIWYNNNVERHLLFYAVTAGKGG